MERVNIDDAWESFLMDGTIDNIDNDNDNDDNDNNDNDDDNNHYYYHYYKDNQILR